MKKHVILIIASFLTQRIQCSQSLSFDQAKYLLQSGDDGVVFKLIGYNSDILVEELSQIFNLEGQAYFRGEEKRVNTEEFILRGLWNEKLHQKLFYYNISAFNKRIDCLDESNKYKKYREEMKDFTKLSYKKNMSFLSIGCIASFFLLVRSMQCHTYYMSGVYVIACGVCAFGNHNARESYAKKIVVFDSSVRDQNTYTDALDKIKKNTSWFGPKDVPFSNLWKS